MKILNWNQFNSCVNTITSACQGKHFSGVYGFPRGGLCLAVALSHSMNIPFLVDLIPGCLVVDDVYETGKTLNSIIDIPETTTFVWYSKVTPKWWNAVEISNPDEWIVFPWENKKLAKEDMKLYQMSRSQSE